MVPTHRTLAYHLTFCCHYANVYVMAESVSTISGFFNRFRRPIVVDSPRFPDGELDVLPLYLTALPSYGKIDSEPKAACEERRGDLINLLWACAREKGYEFGITHPANVKAVDNRASDIWGFIFGEDQEPYIQIPRYALESRPQAGEDVRFRQDLPAFLIVASMAHEITHGDRHAVDEERYENLYYGFRQDNRHELDLSLVEDEELATDAGALKLLETLEIPLSLSDYVDTIPQPTTYHDRLVALVTG
jgi:hypothetical protein